MYPQFYWNWYEFPGRKLVNMSVRGQLFAAPDVETTAGRQSGTTRQ
jgi:hypothetical protein